MWVLRVGGVSPESRTEVVGEYASLGDIRNFLSPLESETVKVLERVCDGGSRVQWIMKDPETRGKAGVIAHLEAVVFEAERS